jgi:hypothetical protein
MREFRGYLLIHDEVFDVSLIPPIQSIVSNLQFPRRSDEASPEFPEDPKEKPTCAVEVIARPHVPR